ncbi:hypothetical protein SeMB42_g07370 [Synchytrium endobioticum]|uniref:mannan endo-1,4-beta-mannosidase n=1 Tax=Synchytrium endobioticum TaxID=286115 RepID=A0A507C4T1_9FUNG|nr:hypothetical protein SeMB42_g07370 [Synchytrium endobioticum]
MTSVSSLLFSSGPIHESPKASRHSRRDPVLVVHRPLPPPHTAPQPTMNYLRRNGSLIYDGNYVFRFVSYNAPNLHFNEDGSIPIPYEQDDTLLSIHQINGRVVRLYVLSVQSSTDYPIQRHIVLNTTSPNTALIFNDVTMRGLDQVLALARLRQVRVILPLIDNWSYWGGVKEFAQLFNQPRDTFFTNSTLISAFTGLIRSLADRNNTVNGIRYGDDPVLIWETGNELQTASYDMIPASWTLTVARFIKSVAPNALVIDGAYGLRGFSSEVLTDPAVDVVSNHYYPLAALPTSYTVALSILLLSIIGSAIWVAVICYMRWGCCIRRPWKSHHSDHNRPLPATPKRATTITSRKLIMPAKDIEHDDYPSPPSPSPSPSPSPPPSPSCCQQTHGTAAAPPSYDHEPPKRRPPSLLYIGIIASILVGLLIPFIVLGQQTLRDYYLHQSYAKGVKADLDTIAGRKPLLVGEFGMVPLGSVTQLLDVVVASQALGALMWSLRSHHRDGGFYTHSEGYGYHAYHHPGMPSDSSGGFPSDDSTIPPLIRQYASRINGQPAPFPITPPAPTLLSTMNGDLIWRGSAGASSYQIERSDGSSSNSTWSLVARNVADNKPGGGVLYHDDGYRNTNGDGDGDGVGVGVGVGMDSGLI